MISYFVCKVKQYILKNQEKLSKNDNFIIQNEKYPIINLLLAAKKGLSGTLLVYLQAKVYFKPLILYRE